MCGAVRVETGTSDNPRKFTGKEYEKDVKLYHFPGRAVGYDPYIGRFNQRDPAGYGVNWYAYANNNPLKHIDPTGLEPVQSGVTTVAEFTEHLDGRKNPDGSSMSLSDYKPTLTRQVEFSNEGPRYIATEKYGWVDMQHFMAAAALAADVNYGVNRKLAYDHAYDLLYLGELGQKFDPFKDRSASAFSYEDLPSNDAGATFGAYHYDPEGGSLADQVGDFLNHHAGPQGVQQKNSAGEWVWAERPESFHDLPAKADSSRQPITNYSKKPIDLDRLKRR